MSALRLCARAACLGALAFASGCSSDPDVLTQIQITVDSDLDVPDQLDRVAIEVAGMVTDEAASADLREQGLPRKLTLLHEGGPLGPVRVTAIGFLRGDQVVERVVETRFQAGKLVSLAIQLQRACLDVSCRAGASCDEGECRSISDGSPVGTTDGGGAGDGGGGEDGGLQDAGDDAGPSDAGSDTGVDSGSDAGDSDAGDSGVAPNRRPICTITEPLPATALIAGQSVGFAGRCDDPETGRVRTGLTWSSDVEASLCSGAMCEFTFATGGTRIVRLCAPDPTAASLQGCVSVTINVRLPAPPTVSIDSVEQSGSSAQPFSTGAAIVLAGSAEGQELTLTWRDTLVGEFAQDSLQASLIGPLVGRHVVTLTATDNVMQMRQATATFVVLAQNAAQLVQPFATSNGVLATAGGARIDALAHDSLDHALLANPLPAIYMLDGQNPSTAGLSLEQTTPTIPAAVHAIAISEADARVYFATGNGLTVCDYAASSGVGASCTSFRNGQFPANDLRSVARARAEGTDYLLAGTQAGLLVTTNLAGANSGQRAIENHAIAGLAAADDLVWVATGDDGLWVYELANDEASAIDDAPSAQLSAVVVDSQGAVWVGSDDGVGRYDPEHDSWLYLRTEMSPEPHLIGNGIRCLAAQRTLIDGTPHDLIWIGTDLGVTRFDTTLGTLMNLTEDDGLPNASVGSIAVLLDGSKLFGTDSGLARYAGP